jgi:hypothetical protein
LVQHETEPIGQLLVDRGWISADQLYEALSRQRHLGGRLGTALLEMGAILEDLLVRALAEQSGLPLADIDELRRIPQTVLDQLPAREAIRHRAVPFRATRGHVDLAVSDEPDIATLDELAFVLGKRVVIHITNEARIQEALESYYGDGCPMRLTRLLEQLNKLRDNRSRHEEQPAKTEPRPTTEADGQASPAPASTDPPPVSTVAAQPPPGPQPTSVKLSPDEKKSLRNLASRDRVKPLSQDGVQRALQAASRADDIGVALLGFLGQEFLRLLVFRAGQGRVKGWMGRSPALDEYGFRNWQVGFDEPSVFLNLRQGAEFFLGRLPPMPAHERLLNCWRGSFDTECAVFPIKVRDRLVCAVYGDRDSLGLAGLDVQAIQRLTAKAAIAFEMLLIQRKLRS